MASKGWSSQPPLPPGWEECRTETGEVYYQDHNRGVTQWERPAPPATQTMPPHRAPYRPPVPAPPAAARSGSPPLPPGWSKGTTNAGEVYFIDHNTKSSTWEDPRKAFAPPGRQPAGYRPEAPGGYRPDPRRAVNPNLQRQLEEERRKEQELLRQKREIEAERARVEAQLRMEEELRRKANELERKRIEIEREKAELERMKAGLSSSRYDRPAEPRYNSSRGPPPPHHSNAAPPYARSAPRQYDEPPPRPPPRPGRAPPPPQYNQGNDRYSQIRPTAPRGEAPPPPRPG
eukprot:EG_transcript_22411